MSGGLCLGVVSVQGGLCPGVLLSRGISVQGGLCPGGLCQGGLCPGGSLSWGGLSGRWEELCPGGLYPGRPPDRDPPYTNAWTVRFLLESILVFDVFKFAPT